MPSAGLGLNSASADATDRDQPADPVGMVRPRCGRRRCRPSSCRRSGASRAPSRRGSRDRLRGGHQRAPLARVALAEARQVEHERAEVLGEHRQVAAEVRPAADARTRAVQQQQGRPVAGLVVVQRALVGLERAARGVVRQLVHRPPSSHAAVYCTDRSKSARAIVPCDEPKEGGDGRTDRDPRHVSRSRATSTVGGS